MHRRMRLGANQNPAPYCAIIYCRDPKRLHLLMYYVVNDYKSNLFWPIARSALKNPADSSPGAQAADASGAWSEAGTIAVLLFDQECAI
jgi:hypothetical protein